MTLKTTAGVQLRICAVLALSMVGIEATIFETGWVTYSNKKQGQLTSPSNRFSKALIEVYIFMRVTFLRLSAKFTHMSTLLGCVS